MMHGDNGDVIYVYHGTESYCILIWSLPGNFGFCTILVVLCYIWC